MSSAELARIAELRRAGHSYEQIGQELHYSTLHIGKVVRREYHHLASGRRGRTSPKLRLAAKLRDQGLTWQAVADALGYAHPFSAQRAARNWRKRQCGSC